MPAKEEPVDLSHVGLVLGDAIGVGGMATVFAAAHPQWGDVAVKVLRADARVRHRRRFAEEVVVLTELRHPNIVRVHAAGTTDDGRAWIAMERVFGGSWLQDIRRGGVREVAQVAGVALDVLAGLEHAHEHGVIHRDIKPQNVLLDEQGTAKLCDFGIARSEEPMRPKLTMTGDRLGTLSYMPPEQRTNPRDVSAVADLYAVGSSLYVALAVRKAPDLSLVDLRPELLDAVPQALRGVIWKATRYDPEKRYQTAREMSRAILERVKVPR